MARGEDGLRLLGASSLLKNVRELRAEEDGVRKGEDIEAVHRTRVASRRLRAGMVLFPSCLPAKRARRWRKDIRNVTRALGEARDLDVQIETLLKIVENTSDAARPGMDAVIELKRAARESIQPSVVKWLEELEDRGTAREMEEYLSAEVEHLDGVDVRTEASHAAGLEHISARIRELVALEGCVPLPDAKEEHHKMRIAAKHLRYSAEAFRPLFDDKLKDEIATLKGLQDLLGEMHDCDVWMSAEGDLTCQLCSVPGAQEGVSALMRDRRKRRGQRYRSFAAMWPKLRRGRFFEDLEDRFRSLPGAEAKTAEERRKELYGLAMEMNVDPDHARKVTQLALALFGHLDGVHGLDEDDRFLLEAAGLLHDIGWVEGQKGHNKTSRRIVLTDERIPLHDDERRMVSAVVRYHRGRLPRKGDKELEGLSGDEKDRTVKLAALLRIADGLDYGHSGAVKGVAVATDDGSVTITLEADGAGAEVAAALDKADLFQSIFGRRVVIR